MAQHGHCPWAEALDRDGWAVTEPLVPELELAALGVALAAFASGHERRGGVRNLLEISAEVRALAESPAVRGVVEAVLGAGAFAVRALLFDKTPATNWKVAWHQDRTVAVRERREVPGFGPWTVKAGVPHAQAPASVLERMLAVRVHLDPCGAGNGPIRFLPGSHRGGKLSPAAIEEWRRREPACVGLAPRGALLAFRPLLLHASSAAEQPGHRRVVHLELAAEDLPAPLEWHCRIPSRPAPLDR